jgi:hypothetical protein
MQINKNLKYKKSINKFKRETCKQYLVKMVLNVNYIPKLSLFQDSM